ncbi:glycosyltransferase [Sphingomonas rubra]|uniref:Glycosyltransferase like family 2 n=1 Tax=Sphingomonas rubra TaxID=634430 RepID=A0A1I5UIN4_9SPHN|nr:glycosyltransferase [Sphingomonas rubra]SFP95144.1 Glycosyltransferase like family 2 [Sphingomonas rubra]
MLAIVDVLAFEAMLFAAVGLLIGGLDDLGIDLLFLMRHVHRRGMGRWSVANLPNWTNRGTVAVFVPAWDEAAVIGGMLRAALARFDHADYRIYVGLYPNDPDCIAAARAVADGDPRVRLVIGPRDGPTTKADCLNTLWRSEPRRVCRRSQLLRGRGYDEQDDE